MSFWGLELKSGSPKFHFRTPGDMKGDLRITKASLGKGKSTKNSYVECKVGSMKPMVICSLIPCKNESCTLDLKFTADELVQFSVDGPRSRSVFLTGYFVDDHSSRHSDSELPGIDIEFSESEESSLNSDKDEYHGSFIDDTSITDDAGLLGQTPSNSGEKMHVNDKKRKEREVLNRNVVSESEDEGGDGKKLSLFRRRMK